MQHLSALPSQTTLSPHMYEISNDLARVDVFATHSFFSQTYWSPDIPLEIVRKAIQNSMCVTAWDGGKQVGFARAVTDKATFAYLADVYVLEDYRGHVLSRRMVDALLQNPELQGLRRFMLATRDAHGLYKKFGFKALAAPDRFMELHNPNTYAAAARSDA